MLKLSFSSLNTQNAVVISFNALSSNCNICIHLGSVLVYLFFSNCGSYFPFFACLRSFLLNVSTLSIFGGFWRTFCSINKHTWTLFCNAAPLLGHSFRCCFYELLYRTTVMLIEGTIFSLTANDKHLVLSEYSNLRLLGCSRLAGENKHCEISEYYLL